VNELRPTDFTPFFKELWQKTPFHWQENLAHQVCDGQWPDFIALPTAAGKTACIDIALFALAYQADLLAEKRTAPRRIFLVVDRRVIVEEAYRRADRLRCLLEDPANAGPTVKRVAERLREHGRSGRIAAVVSGLWSLRSHSPDPRCADRQRQSHPA